MQAAVVILAAGQGTRMRSDLPKALHKLAGAPLLIHALKAADRIAAARTIVVTGHGAEAVETAALSHDEAIICVPQTEQLGTGHAVRMAKDALSDFDGLAIVLFCDTPFIRTETLTEMASAIEGGQDVVFLGFEAEDPARYGRMIADGDQLHAIVEAKDASPEELAITLCNSGVVCASSKVLFDLVDQLDNINAQQEYYLTAIAEIAQRQGLNCGVVTCDEAETLGVNSRADLATAEAVFQDNARLDALENGITLTAPETVFFAHDTVIGRDVTIAPNVVFGPEVTIEAGATINAFCHLEGCHISEGATIGPFARLRPGAEIGEDARIGNFVEVKAAQIAEGAKVNHLSYIGDASIGTAANIGAGTITCNYDGVFKHRTEIGARAFVGSNSALVAPVRIGDDALIGSGSVITGDVPEGDLALGRARQQNKAGLGAKFMARLRALKAKGKG
ncbi:bifunctional UDP-N-acetylglucosamine diphosphorylase/glucosamine-1-phosphate N-acetyltransferase GlmU [Halovulum sp. GXIMD14793]